MSMAKHLSVLALRGTMEGALTRFFPERAVESVTAKLIQHFTDHSKTLTKAMQRANDRAWRSLEVALAGERLRTWFDNADRKALSEQVRAFLNQAPLGGLEGHGEEFRGLCLKELKAARQQDLLGGSLQPAELATEVGAFARFDDPQSILDEEWRAIERMAGVCDDAGLATLASLIRLRGEATQQTPLLVVAVRFFFRREVETDAELFQGLAFMKLELLQSGQDEVFNGVLDVMQLHAEQLQAGIDSLLGLVTEVHGDVKEIRQGVADLAQRFELLQREIRPRDSLSITNETDLRRVRKLIDKYRALPEQQRLQAPELLNDIGKLELATGDFEHAQSDFAEAAALTTDQAEKAEAQFNLYGAALERGDFDAALQALTEAARLDAKKYEPFPLRKYEPEKILGAGGFGVAFLCRNRMLGTQVVIKTLRSDTLDRDMKEVFREAQVLEELDHPAIIRLRDCDYADEHMTRPFIVMDYFNGGTLEEYIEKNGPMSADELLSLLWPISEALQAAHARNILHRDVKPGNLLVRRDDAKGWNVKLIDFGLALKQNVMHTTAASAAVSQRTVTGYSIAGTIDYAAPEQLGKLPGVGAGTYTDVFGLARTCCYALFQTVQPLRKHWRQVPEELADFLEECLSERPEDRLRDFGVVLEKLNRLAGPAEPQAPIHSDTSMPVGEAQEQWQSQEPMDAATAKMNPDWWRNPPTAISDDGRMEELIRLNGHNDAVLSVAFSPNGRSLLTGSADQTARLWEVSSGLQMTELHGHTDKVWAAIFHPVKDVLTPNRERMRLGATASKDKSVQFWNLKTGESVRSFPSRTNRSLAISPDGQYALTGNVSDGMIRLWEIKTGRELRRLKGHMSWVLSLAFLPNGRQALSSSADGTVRLWDVHSGREVRRLQGHTDQVWSIAISAAGGHALSSSADRSVRLWDLRTGKELRCFDDYKDQVWSVAFSPDGHYALTDGDAFAIRLWDLDEGREIAAPVAHNGKVLSVAFSPDGRLAASASSDKSVVVWRVKDR